MTKRALFSFLVVLALSACDDDVKYKFQPEDKDLTCGVVIYNDPDNDDGDVPRGRYCATESGKR